MKNRRFTYAVYAALLFFIISIGCSGNTAVTQKPTLKTSEAGVKPVAEKAETSPQKPKQEPRFGRYALPAAGDARPVQIYADDFHKLSYKNKMLSYYLYLAGLACRDVYWDQMHKHSLKIRDIIEGIYLNKEVVDPAVFPKIKEYAYRLWLNCCQYNVGRKTKFVPDFTYEELVAAAKAACHNGAKFKLGENETLEERLEMLKPYMFDINFEPMITSKNPPAGEDILTYSSNNFYEGVTNAEVAAWAKAGGEKHPLNSKVVKEDGKIVEKVYRAGDPGMGIAPGMYAKELGLAIKYLEKAAGYAEEDQAKTIRALIKYYKTGDPKDFDAYNISWVTLNPDVDFMHSFVEVYMDSRGQKGSFESYVFYKDFVSVDFMKKCSDLAPYFEKKAPWLDKYKKNADEFSAPPVANNVVLISAMGDGGPSTPAAFNLPNAQWIREEYGSKNVMLRNSMGGNVKGIKFEPREPSDYQKEFYHPAELEFLKKLDGNVGYTVVTLHEIIGHGSGKTPDLKGDPSKYLGEFYSTLEETRANLMAYWNLHDPKLKEIGAVPTDYAADEVYHNIARSCVLHVLSFRGQKTIEHDHRRGGQLVRNYLWKKCKAVKVEEIDGKIYATPVSVQKMREGVGKLLAEIMRIKAEGDYEAAKNLVQTYGIYIDQDLMKKVTTWFDKWNAKQMKNQQQQNRRRIMHSGVSFPVLMPVKDRSGKIIDVKAEHWHDFDREMLYYGSYIWKE